MLNPNTTVLGYTVLVGAVSTLLVNILTHGTVSASDLTSIINALAGIGLIVAEDGGH